MTSLQKKKVFNALFVIVFAVTLGFSVVNPFFPVYMKTLTGQGLIIALVFSGFFLAKMILTPVLCRWSDFASRKIFIICGLALHTAAAFIFLWLPENVLLILVLRFVQGAATAMVRPVAQAFVGDMTPENHEGSSMGTFDVSFYAALGMGPILGGVIGDCIGYRGLFLVLLILCFTALLIAITSIHPDKPVRNNPGFSTPSGGNLFRDRTLQGLFAFIFTRSFGVVILPIFLPLYLQSHLGASHLEIGICIAAGSIATALLLRSSGKLSDLWNRKTLVTSGGVASGLVLVMLPMANQFWQALALSLLLAFFSTLSLPASTALLVEKGRDYGLGASMGITHTIMNIGFFAGPLAAGLLMDAWGLDSVFRVAGLTGIAGVLIFVLRCPENSESGACEDESVSGAGEERQATSAP